MKQPEATKRRIKFAFESLNLNIQCLKFFNNEMFYRKKKRPCCYMHLAQTIKVKEEIFLKPLKSKTTVSQFVDRYAVRQVFRSLMTNHLMTCSPYRQNSRKFDREKHFDICSECDSDGNGFLSHNELKSVFASTGVVINETDLDNLVSMMDTDGDNAISIQNLLNYLVKTQHQLTEPLL